MPYKDKNQQKEYIKAYQKDWYQRNKDRIKSKSRINNPKYIERNKNYICNYLSSHPCIDCGESDLVVLDFDHLENKEFNIGVQMHQSGSLNKLIVEIEKCEVVCANCHRRRTARRSNSFRHRYGDMAKR